MVDLVHVLRILKLQELVTETVCDLLQPERS